MNGNMYAIRDSTEVMDKLDLQSCPSGLFISKHNEYSYVVEPIPDTVGIAQQVSFETVEKLYENGSIVEKPSRES